MGKTYRKEDRKNWKKENKQKQELDNLLDFNQALNQKKKRQISKIEKLLWKDNKKKSA
jgi:hypothetical protein